MNPAIARRKGSAVAAKTSGSGLTSGMATFADVNQQVMIARLSGLSPRL